MAKDRCAVAADGWWLVGERESRGKYMSDGKVEEEALSAFVRSQEGKVTGERVWEELRGILEKVDEGVVEGLV